MFCLFKRWPVRVISKWQFSGRCSFGQSIVHFHSYLRIAWPTESAKDYFQARKAKDTTLPRYLESIPILVGAFLCSMMFIYPSLRTSSPEKNQPGFLIWAILESRFPLTSNLSFSMLLVCWEMRCFAPLMVKLCRPILIFFSSL